MNKKVYCWSYSPRVIGLRDVSKEDPNHICKRALLNGKLKCKTDNLLTACKTCCKDLDLPDV